MDFIPVFCRRSELIHHPVPVSPGEDPGNGRCSRNIFSVYIIPLLHSVKNYIYRIRQFLPDKFGRNILKELFSVFIPVIRPDNPVKNIDPQGKGRVHINSYGRNRQSIGCNSPGEEQYRGRCRNR